MHAHTHSHTHKCINTHIWFYIAHMFLDIHIDGWHDYKLLPRLPKCIKGETERRLGWGHGKRILFLSFHYTSIFQNTCGFCFPSLFLRLPLKLSWVWLESHHCLKLQPHGATEECLFIQHPVSYPVILYSQLHELNIGLQRHC